MACRFACDREEKTTTTTTLIQQQRQQQREEAQRIENIKTVSGLIQPF